MIHRVALLSLSLLALPTFAHEFIGKPARMTVTAGQPLAFSFTEGLSDGTAKIKLKKPGLWMVRVEHSTPEVTADYARYVGRSVLVFNVK
ncbi:MAG: hypothetical protein LH632_12855 [Rhodoferax sp.]|nr:hypothetical protein [Rhodoferax sp.]